MVALMPIYLSSLWERVVWLPFLEIMQPVRHGPQEISYTMQKAPPGMRGQYVLQKTRKNFLFQLIIHPTAAKIITALIKIEL